MDNKVLIALSGGVDSAVAAYLLKQRGYECAGVTLSLRDNSADSLTAVSDLADARSICERLGIPHYVFDCRAVFNEQVIRRFTAAYLSGRTPNPCVDCNRYVKFGALWQQADAMGFDFLATGHYARVEPDTGDCFQLKKAAYTAKDQSYVLYTLPRERLAHTLFPLGGLCKSEVRAIAQANGFVNAHKKESQDICFVPDGDYAAFIARSTGETPPPGDFTDEAGRVLGRHKGLTHYTVGQRKGLGYAFQKPMYVAAKNANHNTVVLVEHEALFSRKLYAEEVNWLSPRDESGSSFRASAKIRYNQADQGAWVTPLPGGRMRVEFDEPQRAAAPGQAVVVYDGDTVVCGGTILAVDEYETETGE